MPRKGESSVPFNTLTRSQARLVKFDVDSKAEETTTILEQLQAVTLEDEESAGDDSKSTNGSENGEASKAVIREPHNEDRDEDKDEENAAMSRQWENNKEAEDFGAFNDIGDEWRCESYRWLEKRGLLVRFGAPSYKKGALTQTKKASLAEIYLPKGNQLRKVVFLPNHIMGRPRNRTPHRAHSPNLHPHAPSSQDLQ